jgi:uncharacterized peroxidase-related enzyme
VQHHGAGLRKLLSAAGWTPVAQDELIKALSTDYTAADLSAADRAMLDYAVKLTRTPSTIEAADVDALRAVSFDDRAIHDICCIASYFAFVNRVADGLGVELEDDRAWPADRVDLPD